MNASLISLGANLGHVRESMFAAKHLLQEHFGKENVVLSHLYRSPPVGGPTGQHDFLNAVASIRSSHSAWEIWDFIKQIESTLGRNRQQRWEARRIDVDLLLHNQERIWTPHLKVPHPRMCMRSFILTPAAEIAKSWIDPVTERTIDQLSQHLGQTRDSNDKIRVICESHPKMVELCRCFAMSEQAKQIPIEWEIMPCPHSLYERDKKSNPPSQPKLTIVTVASPDPLTVFWEDFSAPWAHWMRLSGYATSSDFPSCIAGPRYLLPSNDVTWAAHEILAAHQAMNSWIEIAEPFEA